MKGWTTERAEGASPRGRSRDVSFALRVFLILGCPLLLAYCFLIGPFEASDEPNHFLRIVAVSEGHFLPVLSPPGPRSRSAGAMVDSSADALARSMDDVVRDSGKRFTRHQIAAMLAVRPSHRQVYSAHSNTAIYPPFFYAVPATAIAFARALDLPVLDWLYLGRLANLLVGAAIVAAALARARDTALFVLTAAMLPLSLFQTATLSADALLFPLFLLFAVLLVRIVSGPPASARETAALALASFVLGVGKVAYLPLGLLPILAARLADGHWSGRARALAAGFAVTLLFWAGWAAIVHDKVFSIRPNVVVDSAGQLRFLLGHPAQGVAILIKSMLGQLPNLTMGVVGRRLGWQEVITPVWLVGLCLLAFVGTALVAERPLPRSRAVLVAGLVLGLGCFVAIFLLLYLQYNAVASPSVEGVQGRYLTPLLVVVLCLTPRRRVRAETMGRIRLVIVAWSVISAAETIWLLTNRYWI